MIQDDQKFQELLAKLSEDEHELKKRCDRLMIDADPRDIQKNTMIVKELQEGFENRQELLARKGEKIKNG